jgi:ABC-type transport system involved in cytochrome c biogenesis permease component
MRLIKKELIVELRNPKALSTVLGLTLILGIFVALGLNRSQVSNLERILPGVWLSVLSFILFVGTERMYDSDKRSLDGLVLFHKIPPLEIFLSKLTLSIVYGTLSGSLMYIVIFTFCGINSPLSAINVVLISLIFSVGVSSIGITLSRMTSQTLGRFILIPILGVPLISPLFFGLIEVYYGFTIYNDTFWLWFCCLIDILYFGISGLLYSRTFR